MKKVVKLTEADLTKMIQRVVNEQEDDTSMDEHIDWNIKTTDCEGSRFGNMSSMGVDKDEDGNISVFIRYCKGDDEELEYLKRKARRQIKMENQLPSDDETISENKKKVVKLTESDLARIIKRVINESEVDEGVFDTILKAFKGDAKVAAKEFMPRASKGLSSMPLLQQLPNEVRTLINKLPGNVKVGSRLDGLFKKSMFDIQSLEGSIARLNREMNGVGGAEMYSRNLSELVRKPKGAVIDLKDMYTKAQFLKKELENIKEALPRPKEGGMLNKNKNFKAELDKYANFLWNDMGKINRFISDFDEMLKNAKVK
jgi:hypothetical protein